MSVTPTSTEVPVTQRQGRELVAKIYETSRTSMERAAFVSRVADDERMPEELRHQEAELMAEVQAGTVAIWHAYEAVRLTYLAMGLRWCQSCATCGVDFQSTREDAVYHSNACRQRAYRQRGGA